MPAGNFPNRPIRLESSHWVLSQSQTANDSWIRVQGWMRKNAATTATYRDLASSIEGFVNGAKVATKSFGFAFTDYDELMLFQVDVLVPHNADGTKTVAIDLYCNAQILGYTEAHYALELPRISRATKASFVGGNELTAGTAVTISTPREVGSYTHDLYWYFGTKTAQSVASGVGTSTSWTPPLSMLSEIPNDVRGNGHVRVFTINGGSIVGQVDLPFWVTAPASVKPTIGTLTYVDQNPEVVSKVGKPVQGLSSVKVTVPATGVYGSTITAKSATVDGISAPDGTAIPLTKSGDLTVIGIATDSRGRTETKADTLNVLAYTAPNVTALTVQRCNVSGVPTADGAYLRVDLAATVASLINGTQKNAMQVKVRTRLASGGAWTDRNTINPGLTHSGWFQVTGGAQFSAASQWLVEVTISDIFQAGKIERLVSTEATILDLGSNNVGVAKRWERGALDVGGDIYQNNNKVVDAGTVATATAQGIVELATNAETVTGTDTVRAVTPAGVKAAITAGDTAGWVLLPLGTGWAGYATEKAYYRVKSGQVHLMGRVTGQASAGTTIGTLPVGARGSFPQTPVWSGHSDDGATVLLADSNGNIVIASRIGAIRQGVSLAGITFPLG